MKRTRDTHWDTTRPARWRPGRYVAVVMGALWACTPKGVSIPSDTPPSPSQRTTAGGTYRAPSFGQGAELPPQKAERARSLRHRPGKTPPPPEIERSPALAAPSSGDTETPDPSVTASTPGPAHPRITPDTTSADALPPEPPPTGADAIVRTVYRLQAQVYGLRLLLDDPRIRPQLRSRIDAAEQTAEALVSACRGNASCQPDADEISAALSSLQASTAEASPAETHPPGMKQVLSELAEHLSRLRGLLSP